MTIIADGDNEEETADIFDYIHTTLACPAMNNSTESLTSVGRFCGALGCPRSESRASREPGYYVIVFRILGAYDIRWRDWIPRRCLSIFNQTGGHFPR